MLGAKELSGEWVPEGCESSRIHKSPWKGTGVHYMTDRKRTKKDNRSSVTVHLPAAYADFVVGLLARELEHAHREGQTGLAATIRDILNPLRSTIELEEEKRALRGQTAKKKGDLEAQEPGVEQGE